MKREGSILSRCSCCRRRRRVRKVADLDPLPAVLLDRTTGHCVFDSEMGCDSVLRALRQLSERSHKCLSLSDEQHASKRGGGGKKGGGGYRRGRQCGFAMRSFLCTIYTHIQEKTIWRCGRRIPPDLAFYWFDLFNIRSGIFPCSLIENKNRDEISNRNPEKTS